MQALLARLWRLRCPNDVKEAFWLLVHDGHPTAARLRTTCLCGAEGPGDRLHHYWGCPAARAVTAAISAALGATTSRPAVWLCRAPAGVHSGVWALVCLAAVDAMDHARRVMYALSTGPQPDAPLYAIAGRSAVVRFWSHLADFLALDCVPPAWRASCPAGHPFFHTDPASGAFALNHPAPPAAPPAPPADA